MKKEIIDSNYVEVLTERSVIYAKQHKWMLQQSGVNTEAKIKI